MDFKQAFDAADAMDDLKKRILEVNYLDKFPDFTVIRQYELSLRAV